MSRLEEYCKGNISSDEIIENARRELLGAPQINISQINFIDELNKILLARHECLKVVEDTIANDSTLLKFFIGIFKPDDSNGYEFKVALERMSKVLSEYEKGYAAKDKEELIARIQELEAKNKELQDTLDRIAKIFGVIDKNGSE